MFTRQSALNVFVVVVLGSLLGAPAHGTTALHTNILTFSGPVALPGVTLPSGTYVFEQLDVTSPDIVVVRNKERSRVFFLGFTQGSHRPASMRRDRLVTFGEAERGAPARITAWYPLGESRGHAFLYPR